MKKAVVTGAAGFAGCNLSEHLLRHGYKVYAVVRPDSMHNKRLPKVDALEIIELEASKWMDLPSRIPEKCDLFFHLALQGTRDDVASQIPNVTNAIEAAEAAKQLSCTRFFAAGSQAEYGERREILTEDLPPDPVTAYGAAKAAACYLSRRRAQQLKLEWIWGRVFSLYGKYEPEGHMLPALIRSLKNGETPVLSSCRQNWDYLEAGDAAEAMIALAEKGRPGEIYNIAHGEYKPLRAYVDQVREVCAPDSRIVYGEDPAPFISLQPSVEKIRTDTGWKPEVSFENGIKIFM